ncbi:MAG TPA: hypothetical protein VHN37_11075 [Actinomycetota bacterium]|nr:hypothetical protein [Actinomycetota bacterium]
MADYLGNKDDVLEQIKHGGINWAHVCTNCDDFPAIDLTKLFEFLGVANEANANMRFDQEKDKWLCRDSATISTSSSSVLSNGGLWASLVTGMRTTMSTGR